MIRFTVEMEADVNEQERIMIDLAVGKISCEGLSKFLGGKIIHITN